MELGHSVTNEEYFRLKGTMPADRIEKMLGALEEVKDFLSTLRHDALDSIRHYVREDELAELLDKTADAVEVPLPPEVVEAFAQKEKDMYSISVEADTRVEALKETIEDLLEKL